MNRVSRLYRWFHLDTLTDDQWKFVRARGRAGNSTTIRGVARVSIGSYLVFFLGVATGILVPQSEKFWYAYLGLFATGTVLSAVFVAWWHYRPEAGGQGLYLVLAIGCVVALNLLGMIRVGDRSIYLLGLAMTALAFSAPLAWYLTVFVGAWVLSGIGLIILVPGHQALSHFVVLGAMTALPLATAILVEARRIRTELLHWELQEASRRDSLTGLHNRRALMEWLESRLALADRVPSPMALAILDLDRFKDVNDTAGHLVGDEALKSLARRLQAGIRKGDFVSRYGGEEFIVAMPDTSISTALSALGRILAQCRVARISGWDKPITFSAGLVDSRPNESADALIRRADSLLYRAKDQGRDRIEVQES